MLGTTTFRQLDVNKYQVVFAQTDRHTPDLIAWELKQRPEHKKQVSFVETRQNEGVSGDTIELEIHLRTALVDVPSLIHTAAQQSAAQWNAVGRRI